MVMSEAQFSQLLKPALVHAFDVGMNMVPAVRDQLFNVQRSELAYEEGTGIGGIGVDVWDQYKNTGSKGRADFDQLYTETYTHQEYPVELVIKKSLISNDQYGVIADYARRFGISAQQKQEKDAADFLNNAFSSSHTRNDGVALCSASHPVSPNSGSTVSNRGTTALTTANLSTARKNMAKRTDDKGNLIGLTASELWVPEELREAAMELTLSTLDPSTANNAINAANLLGVAPMPWVRLTDTKNWFLMDGIWRNETFKWYERETFESTLMMTHETTTEYVFEAKLYYSYGADDWRAVQGHEVA